ncbi:PilZ domain-containing protein [Thiomicrospira sp. R3]|uniref:PilZ domain-containing protein n=1 Tax=Thiomicrospira sp. R3 TaxID=3035472 RepID=UPI00259B8A22|nr:PilZ domain-containing protein [Thiomicrospira sp. R3]WFE68044.1 PilZ domain-containing protein [Thiomicrospira sp. R3]
MRPPSNTSSSGVEKPRPKRANLDKPATLIVHTTLTPIRVVNISTTGVGVISSQNLPPKTITAIRLSLYFYNELTELTLQAKVVHSTPVQHDYLVGLALFDVNPFTLRVINQFVMLNT